MSLWKIERQHQPLLYFLESGCTVIISHVSHLIYPGSLLVHLLIYISSTCVISSVKVVKEKKYIMPQMVLSLKVHLLCVSVPFLPASLLLPYLRRKDTFQSFTWITQEQFIGREKSLIMKTCTGLILRVSRWPPIYLLCFKLHSIKRHDRLVMTTIH